MFSMNSNDVAAGILIFVVIAIIISLAFREVICWYWKINRNIALLTEIRDLLAAKTDSQGRTSQSQTSVASDDSVRMVAKVNPRPNLIGRGMRSLGRSFGRLR